jgi:hypothetical protein
VRQFSKELIPEGEREFEIGGTVFTWEYPHYELTDRILDEDLEQSKELSDEGTAPSMNGFSYKGDTAKAIERIKLFLPDAAQKKSFDDVLKRKKNPVPKWQIIDLYRWLIEVASRRPTEPPSASSPTGGATEPSSAEAES